MAYTREKKKQIIDKFIENLRNQKGLIFVDYKGIKTKDLEDFKSKLRSVQGVFMVTKKTLFRIAAESFNKDLSEKIKSLEGQLAVVFSFGDEIAAAKNVYEFSKKNENIKILGGFFDNLFREKEEVIAIAKLPSRNELILKLIGSIKSPLFGLNNVLNYNLKGLVVALNQIKDKKG
jgi:large subunit ribosomal protein L10